MNSAATRRARDRFRRRWCLVALASLGLSACAPEISRRHMSLIPMGASGRTIEILQNASIAVGPGYRRVIPRGSLWTRIGRTVEGHVYKSVDHVFTVEGAQIHEAYLVLDDGDRVVGFYLLVERAFVTAPGGPETKLSVKEKDQ